MPRPVLNMRSLRQLGRLISLAVFVPEPERDRTSVTRLRLAAAYRIVGMGIILVVPLAVSYANMAPVVWEMSALYYREGQVFNLRDALMSLSVAFLLAIGHAFYLWFITELVLFRPALERLHFADVLLPCVLASAYVANAAAVTSGLPTQAPEELLLLVSKGLFLALYVLWLARDLSELATLRQNAPDQANKLLERIIWVGVDLVQIIVILMSFSGDWHRYIFGVELHSKDVAVGAALLGLTIINGLLWIQSRSSERDVFSRYLSGFHLGPASRMLAIPDAATILDLGCANGARTVHTAQELFAAKDPRFIGLDNLKEWGHEFRKRSLGQFVAELTGVDVGVIDVVLVSHFPITKRSSRRALVHFLGDVILKATNLRYIVFRGPSPSTMDHIVNRMLDGNLSAVFKVPPLTHLWDRVQMRNVASQLELDPYQCNPETGKPFATIPHIYDLKGDGITDMAQWMSWAYGPATGDFARVWATARRRCGEEMIYETDAVYVFVKRPRP